MVLKQDMEQVAGWLKRLYPPDTPGLVWIGSKSTNFKGQRFHPRDLPAQMREVTTRDRDPGVFVRMSTIRPEAEKRGMAEDSVAVAGFWADIDIAGPGHKHDPSRYENRKLPPDQAAAELLVAHLPEPTAWIASGGGFYPLWLPAKPWVLGDDCTAEEWGRLSVDLQSSIYRAAKERHWHFGMGTGDIARILRIPGTINRKVTGDPKSCDILWGGGPQYSFAELRAAIPEMPEPVAPVRRETENRESPAVALAPIPQPALRKSTRFAAPASPFDADPGAVGPLDDFARRNDLNDLLIADGWTHIYTDGTGRLHYARPGKDAKDGPSGNVYNDGGRQVLYVFSESAGLPTMQGLSVGEYWAHTRYAGRLADAARALRRDGFGTPTTTRPAAPPVNRGGQPGTGTGGSAPNLPATLAETARETFWSERETLTRIHQIARFRGVPPWALLAGVLAHVAVRVGPHVRLPPGVGRKQASLNVFFGVVGRTGGGKDAAVDTADDLFTNLLEHRISYDERGMAEAHSIEIPELEIATGQGVAAHYTRKSKDGLVQFNDTVLWRLNEITSLEQSSKMSGSILMPTILQMYMAQKIGAAYADPEKQRTTGANQYRAVLVAGIQPEMSAVLLNAATASTGMTARWVFVPTTYDGGPGLQRGRFSIPACDPGIEWNYDPRWLAAGVQPDDEGKPTPVPKHPPIEIEVADSITEEMRAAKDKLDSLTMEEAAMTDMEGHKPLAQLKVAALLGLLDGRLSVSEEDWRLARMVMAISDDTKQKCRDILRMTKTRQNHDQAVMDGEREVAKIRTVADAAAGRVAELAEKMLQTLRDAGGQEMTPKKLREVMNSKDRAEYGERAWALLLDIEGVGEGPEVVSGGRKIRKLRWLGVDAQ